MTSVLSLATGMRDDAEALDRAILAKAFRGDLVPQNPADEPASVLLDRIRREHAEAAADGARKPRKTSPDP